MRNDPYVPTTAGQAGVPTDGRFPVNVINNSPDGQRQTAYMHGEITKADSIRAVQNAGGDSFTAFNLLGKQAGASPPPVGAPVYRRGGIVDAVPVTAAPTPYASLSNPGLDAAEEMRRMQDELQRQQQHLRYYEAQLAAANAANTQVRPQEVHRVPIAANVDPARLDPFSVLELPFIRSDKTVRPEYVVIYEFPGIGKHQARYHHVTVTDNAVILVRDTRQDDSYAFIPNEFGEKPITIYVQREPFQVLSLGFQWTFGIFDCLLLPRCVAEQSDSLDGNLTGEH